MNKYFDLFIFFKDTINTLVRYCGPRFFSVPLPGSTMMILDFVHAANTIASTTDLKEVIDHLGYILKSLSYDYLNYKNKI